MRRPDPIIFFAILTALACAYSGPLFSPGEQLHYRGYVFGWIPVGDAWFKVGKATEEGKEVYRFDARALGNYWIYTLDIRLQSVVDAAKLRSVRLHRREVGTEKREYEVVFDRDAGSALYRRKPGRFNTVAEMDAAPWESRSAFPISGEVNDILYTLYFARGIGDTVGTRKEYRFVETSYIWKAAVSIVGERRIDLGKAGSYDALRIAIEPDYTGQPEMAERFRGLFGVEGNLELWVDKRTRIPLIVRGRVPFTRFFGITMSVILADPPAGIADQAADRRE
jgi:hypothetical protein